jgi:hypothetical protein
VRALETLRTQVNPAGTGDAPARHAGGGHRQYRRRRSARTSRSTWACSSYTPPGEHTIAELAEIFTVSRAAIYRTLDRARAA